jgi:acyl-coenzyme A synthetase/AMP-(fatty) acid ligase
MIALGAGPSLAAMEERFGVPVIDWYGMTEAGSGTYTRLDEERRPGSAGRPFDPTQMKILREDGSVADPGEVGEVCFDEKRIHFRGYVNDAEATASVMRGGWFHTGDLGYFDADGFFYFVDRLKDIVRRGGENVSGMEVESVLLSHPDIAEVAVLGRPDPILGERIVAFVVPRAGAHLPSVDDLRKFGEADLATFKLPEEVYAVEALPRTATGKVQKFALRKLLPDASQPQS